MPCTLCHCTPPEMSFHPPSAIPPRTSSSGKNGTRGADSSKLPPSEPAQAGQLQTNTVMTPPPTGAQHARTRPSADGSGSGSGSTAKSSRDGSWSLDRERILMGPYDYMAKHQGKDIRRQLINGFNAWLKVPAESLAVINRVVAMLHNASLL